MWAKEKMIKLKLTTKTARELKRIIENSVFKNPDSVRVIISFKNELKEIIKKHLPLPRLHDDLWDDINKLIQEIESVETHKKT